MKIKDKIVQVGITKIFMIIYIMIVTLTFVLAVDTTPPTITFISQTPTDLMWNSTGAYTNLFNITDEFSINESSIVIFHGINQSYDGYENWNWSWRFPESDKQPLGLRAEHRNESRWWESIIYKQSIDDIWSFGGHDITSSSMNMIDNSTIHSYWNFTSNPVQSMFPSNWFVDKVDMLIENKSNQYIEIYKNRSVKINLNLTANDLTANLTRYTHLNVEPQNSIYNLIYYFCNSSYITGNPTASDNCQAGFDIAGTDIRDLIMKNSSYIAKTGVTTNGYVGNVKLTKNMQLVLMTNEPLSSKAYKLYYANNTIADNTNFAETGVMSTSGNNGISYTTFDGTPDFWFSLVRSDYDKLVTYVYACDDSGNCANSTWQVDTLEIESNLPPSDPTVIYPTEFLNVSSPFYINWTTLGDPDEDNYNASVYLYNQDGTFNKTLADNNITNDKEYYYVNSSIPDGDFRINITLCDALACSGSLTGESFTIDNTIPAVSIVSPVDGFSIYDYTSGSVPVFTNFSLIELYPASCWYSIDGGATNTSVPCSSGYNNFTFSLSSVGTFTLEIYANDSAGNENSTSIQIIVTAYTGPQQGGGATINPSENAIIDFNLYNSTIMCEKVNKFLELRTVNYTQDQRESFKNSLTLIFGFGMTDSVLDEYLENFEGNCPEYFEIDEPDDIDDEESEDRIPLYIWILIAIVVAIILVMIISLKRNDVNLKINEDTKQ